MTVRVYNSLNYSAKFTGQAGSGLAVLDIILLGSGWSKPYTGTNMSVYRNGAGSKQAYFRFDDAGSTTASTRNMKVRGFSGVTDILDSGTNPFPTLANFPQGYFIRKSIAVDAIGKEWFAVVDELVCYLFIFSEGNTTNPILYAFGDFLSDSTTDIYNSFICALNVDSTGQTSSLPFTSSIFTALSTTASPTGGCAIAGSHTGTAGALFFSRHLSTFGTNGATVISNPDSVAGNIGQLMFSPINIHYNNGTSTFVRGIHQGLWFIYNDYQMFVAGNGDPSEYNNLYVKNTATNKILKGFKMGSSFNIFVEISDTWYQ